jgi:hypothetical protein
VRVLFKRNVSITACFDFQSNAAARQREPFIFDPRARPAHCRTRWKQNQRANKEEEALQKTSTAINKAYELTTPSTTLTRNA